MYSSVFPDGIRPGLYIPVLVVVLLAGSIVVAELWSDQDEGSSSSAQVTVEDVVVVAPESPEVGATEEVVLGPGYDFEPCIGDLDIEEIVEGVFAKPFCESVSGFDDVSVWTFHLNLFEGVETYRVDITQQDKIISIDRSVNLANPPEDPLVLAVFGDHLAGLLFDPYGEVGLQIVHVSESGIETVVFKAIGIESVPLQADVFNLTQDRQYVVESKPEKIDLGEDGNFTIDENGEIEELTDVDQFEKGRACAVLQKGLPVFDPREPISISKVVYNYGKAQQFGYVWVPNRKDELSTRVEMNLFQVPKQSPIVDGINASGGGLVYPFTFNISRLEDKSNLRPKIDLSKANPYIFNSGTESGNLWRSSQVSQDPDNEYAETTGRYILVETYPTNGVIPQQLIAVYSVDAVVQLKPGYEWQPEPCKIFRDGVLDLWVAGDKREEIAWYIQVADGAKKIGGVAVQFVPGYDCVDAITNGVNGWNAAGCLADLAGAGLTVDVFKGGKKAFIAAKGNDVYGGVKGVDGDKFVDDLLMQTNNSCIGTVLTGHGSGSVSVELALYAENSSRTALVSNHTCEVLEKLGSKAGKLADEHPELTDLFIRTVDESPEQGRRIAAAANKTKAADPENFDANRFADYINQGGDDAVEAFQRMGPDAYKICDDSRGGVYTLYDQLDPDTPIYVGLTKDFGVRGSQHRGSERFEDVDVGIEETYRVGDHDVRRGLEQLSYNEAWGDVEIADAKNQGSYNRQRPIASENKNLGWRTKLAKAYLKICV